LDVLLKTKVTRLIKSGKESGVPVFRTVEISTPDMRLTARNEIILSAGVINTPQILMRSGIGPMSDLSALDIPVLVDLPSVGKNLTDHLMTSMFFRVKKTTTNDPILQDPAVVQAAFAQWMTTRVGPLAKMPADVWGFMRLPGDDSIMAKTGDSSAGPASAHTEILFGEGFFPLGDIALPKSANYITVLSIVTSPTSRGSVTLNRLHQPVIDPKYMTTEIDQHVAVQGMKDVLGFFEAEAFEGYIGEPYGPLGKLMTDKELLGYVRRFAGTINHGVGTAKMSPRGAEWGIVDPDLKVKGMMGVRIVDASIFVSKCKGV
jgi:choline dehydrogenase-like flavoprotein